MGREGTDIHLLHLKQTCSVYRNTVWRGNTLIYVLLSSRRVIDGISKLAFDCMNKLRNRDFIDDDSMFTLKFQSLIL